MHSKGFRLTVISVNISPNELFRQPDPCGLQHIGQFLSSQEMLGMLALPPGALISNIVRPACVYYVKTGASARAPHRHGDAGKMAALTCPQ